MPDDDDPTLRFLDQTVPRDDAWEGREPDDGPARPRHSHHHGEPVEPLSAKQRRANTLRNVAWGVGPSAAFVAGAALSDDDTDATGSPVDDPDPTVPDGGFGEGDGGI